MGKQTVSHFLKKCDKIFCNNNFLMMNSCCRSVLYYFSEFYIEIEESSNLNFKTPTRRGTDLINLNRFLSQKVPFTPTSTGVGPQMIPIEIYHRTLFEKRPPKCRYSSRMAWKVYFFVFGQQKICKTTQTLKNIWMKSSES